MMTDGFNTLEQSKQYLFHVKKVNIYLKAKLKTLKKKKKKNHFLMIWNGEWWHYIAGKKYQHYWEE